MVDTMDSKSIAARCVGSSPTGATIYLLQWSSLISSISLEMAIFSYKISALMKKISLFIASALISLSAFGATLTDIDDANFLAREWILVDQSNNTTNYRLDESILRQEIIGIALKIKWVTLPEDYVCKNYYTDVKTDPVNNWICRAVEIAADNAMISRENKLFRPQEYVTESEALAILFSALGEKWVPQTEIDAFLKSSGNPFAKDTNSWQMGIIIQAKKLGVLAEYNALTPNARATRGRVFGLATSLLINKDFEKLKSRYDLATEWIDTAKPLGKMTYEYGDEIDISGFDAAHPLARRSFMVIPHSGDPIKALFQYYKSSTTGGIIPLNTDIVQAWIPRSYILLGKEALVILPIGYFYKSDEHIKKFSFVDTSYSLKNIDILKIHYYSINEKSLRLAHEMLTQGSMMSGEVGTGGVSFETFQRAYGGADKVVFREDTVKDLGGNVYEFLVEITTKWLTTTHKVTSRVELLNFKIEQISSVRQ